MPVWKKWLPRFPRQGVSSASGTVMSTEEKNIYFVRHAKSESNTDGIFRGSKAVLTEEGREQARVVAKRVARIGVDTIISSAYPRAVETASIIAEDGHVPHEEQALFGEWRHATEIQGRHRLDPETIRITEAWFNKHDVHDFAYSDEESFTELSERAAAALAFLERHPASRLCVVTHGGFLRVIIGTLLFREMFTKPLFVRLFRRLTVDNTGITHVVHTPEGGWKLVSLNDSAHLG